MAQYPWLKTPEEIREREAEKRALLDFEAAKFGENPTVRAFKEAVIYGGMRETLNDDYPDYISNLFYGDNPGMTDNPTSFRDTRHRVESAKLRLRTLLEIIRNSEDSRRRKGKKPKARHRQASLFAIDIERVLPLLDLIPFAGDAELPPVDRPEITRQIDAEQLRVALKRAGDYQKVAANLATAARANLFALLDGARNLSWSQGDDLKALAVSYQRDSRYASGQASEFLTIAMELKP